MIICGITLAPLDADFWRCVTDLPRLTAARAYLSRKVPLLVGLHTYTLIEGAKPKNYLGKLVQVVPLNWEFLRLRVAGVQA